MNRAFISVVKIVMCKLIWTLCSFKKSIYISQITSLFAAELLSALRGLITIKLLLCIPDIINRDKEVKSKHLWFPDKSAVIFVLSDSLVCLPTLGLHHCQVLSLSIWIDYLHSGLGLCFLLYTCTICVWETWNMSDHAKTKCCICFKCHSSVLFLMWCASCMLFKGVIFPNKMRKHYSCQLFLCLTETNK